MTASPLTTPQETAATWSFIGLSRRIERCVIHFRQSASAIQAPVIAAVRVPPSACRTSQSRVICRSPRRGRSTTARSERPIRRWISWVRPGDFAGRGFAPRACRGRARQHRVFRGDPALALAAQPRRRLVLERGRAQNVGLAEAHEARALGVARDAALESHFTHFVVGALGGSHRIVPCRRRVL